MAITANKTEEVIPNKRSYPCLKRFASTGTIVLFTSPNTGTIVYSSRKESIGDYSTTWIEFNGDLFTGSVTLQNEQ